MTGKKERDISAADFLPHPPTLPKMQKAVQKCQGCPLYKDATQAVFGEGNADASFFFIGEQPGDVEDKQGRPFVGPAGRVLYEALAAAGIDRDDCYVTNAVKHFRYEWRGKRRIHSKPRRIEVVSCLPWLIEEMNQIEPKVIVCLGATAAQALLGASFKVTKHRGKLIPFGDDQFILPTVHPSSILRARTDDDRHRQMKEFIDDLKVLDDFVQRR